MLVAILGAAVLADSIGDGRLTMRTSSSAAGFEDHHETFDGARTSPVS